MNNVSAIKNKLQRLLHPVVALGLSVLLGLVIQWPSSFPAQAQSPDSGTPTASQAVIIAATARIDDPLALRNTAILTAAVSTHLMMR